MAGNLSSTNKKTFLIKHNQLQEPGSDEEPQDLPASVEQGAGGQGLRADQAAALRAAHVAGE